METDPPTQLSAPDLPKYVREPLEKQSPERLEAVAAYASELAEWKRHQQQQEVEERRSDDEISEEELDALEERGISTNPGDYDDVPASGAYITVKTTKRTSEKSYRYFYWQWREGDAWKNEYIAPVNPRRES
jgi:hypothetical protein